MKTKSLLLIFTRNPELGKVKTRLAKVVGNEAAFNIYKFLLQHTFSVTKDLEISKEVHYSEEIREDDLWDPAFFGKKLQKGADLGERMENAFKSGFERGFEKIIIIGSDLYDLKTEDLVIAFNYLDISDYVIGPAQDGGYYLLGMKSLHSKIFIDKNWGTNTVLRETLEDLKTKKLNILEMRNDIDTFEDMKHCEALRNFL